MKKHRVVDLMMALVAVGNLMCIANVVPTYEPAPIVSFEDQVEQMKIWERQLYLPKNVFGTSEEETKTDRKKKEKELDM